MRMVNSLFWYDVEKIMNIERSQLFAINLPPCPSKTPKNAASLLRSGKAECWKIAHRLRGCATD
jgi:hypothetical protein